MLCVCIRRGEFIEIEFVIFVLSVVLRKCYCLLPVLVTWRRCAISSATFPFLSFPFRRKIFCERPCKYLTTQECARWVSGEVLGTFCLFFDAEIFCRRMCMSLYFAAFSDITSMYIRDYHSPRVWSLPRQR